MKSSSLKISLAILVSIFWSNTSWTKPLKNNIPAGQNSVPSSWRKIDANGKCSFYLPPNMRVTETGIENYHRAYSNGRTHVSFDYEPYGHLAYENRAIAFGKDFQEMELRVDGRKAFMFVHQSKDWKNRRWYNADLYVGDLPNHEVIVSMLVSSRSPQVVEIAKTIFSTIDFPIP